MKMCCYIELKINLNKYRASYPTLSLVVSNGNMGVGASELIVIILWGVNNAES